MIPAKDIKMCICGTQLGERMASWDKSHKSVYQVRLKLPNQLISLKTFPVEAQNIFEIKLSFARIMVIEVKKIAKMIAMESKMGVSNLGQMIKCI